MTIFTEVRTGRSSLSEIEAPLGDVLEAAAEEAWLYSPTSSLSRMGELQGAERGKPAGSVPLDADIGIPTISGPLVAEPRSPMLSAEDARARINAEKLPLVVPDEGIRAEALEILMRRKREELARQSIRSRGPGGFIPGIATFGTSLAVSALDPLNVASAFIPVIGPSRYAAMLGRAGGAVSRAGVRARVGALEGAVGAAVVEPVILSAARAEQADYDMSDTLLNIALGTALGGGLHVGVGAVADRVAGRQVKDILPRILDEVSPETRAAMLRIGVSQAVTGRQIDVEPALRADPRLPGTMERLSEAQLDELRSIAIKARTESERIRTKLVKEFEKVEERRVGLEERSAETTVLRGEVEQLRSDMTRVMQRIPGLDEGERSRLGRLMAIDEELEGTISRARREQLERERELIDVAIQPGRLRKSLEQEIKGLRRALKRKEDQLTRAEARLIRDAEKIDTRSADIQRQEARELARLQSREEAFLLQARREITMLASQGYGVRLSQEEANKMASRIMSTSGPETLRELSNLLATRAKNVEDLPFADARIAQARMDMDIARAANNSFLPQYARLVDTDAIRISNERIKAATDDEAMISESLTKANEDIRYLAKALGDEELIAREMEPFEDLEKVARSYGNAVKAAANCGLRRGGG